MLSLASSAWLRYIPSRIAIAVLGLIIFGRGAVDAAANPCMTNGYSQAFAYEVASDLALISGNCRAQLTTLTMQQFGPPTVFETFNALCKGACRDLQDRVVRINSYAAATDCACTDINCPRKPVAMLCQFTGTCPDDEDAFMSATCSTSACGRWATNEADYRKACGM